MKHAECYLQGFSSSHRFCNTTDGNAQDHGIGPSNIGFESQRAVFADNDWGHMRAEPIAGHAMGSVVKC